MALESSSDAEWLPFEQRTDRGLTARGGVLMPRVAAATSVMAAATPILARSSWFPVASRRHEA
jgi:hypothetical protein